MIDEFTRICLVIHCALRIGSKEVIEQLADAMVIHGIPKYIRSDNGPEFVARILRDWLKEIGVQTAYIEPSSPWENGFCESFNGTLRDELLNGEIFYNPEEARVLTKQWKDHYSQVRPHSSLGYRPPAPQVMLPKITQIQPGYMQWLNMERLSLAVVLNWQQFNLLQVQSQIGNSWHSELNSRIPPPHFVQILLT